MDVWAALECMRCLEHVSSQVKSHPFARVKFEWRRVWNSVSTKVKVNAWSGRYDITLFSFSN